MAIVLLAISWCLPMHECSIADMPICNNQSHHLVLINLLNRISKIKLKKDVHKYKKICDLRANTEALNVRTLY